MQRINTTRRATRPFLSVAVGCGLLSGFAALAGFAWGQEPGSDETSAAQRREEQVERLARQDEERRKQRRTRNVETLRKLQGAWQLVDYNATRLPAAERQDVAFLLVSGEFFSIEIHMGYFGEQGEMKGRLHQTGTYRLNFNTDSELLAQVLIGSIDIGAGYTEFQTPGIVSVYEVYIREGTLTLISEDESRFKFERVGTGTLTELVYEDIEWLPGAERRAELAEIRALEAKASIPAKDSANEESPKVEEPPGF